MLSFLQAPATPSFSSKRCWGRGLVVHWEPLTDSRIWKCFCFAVNKCCGPHQCNEKVILLMNILDFKSQHSVHGKSYFKSVLLKSNNKTSSSLDYRSFKHYGRLLKGWARTGSMVMQTDKAGSGWNPVQFQGISWYTCLYRGSPPIWYPRHTHFM